jgi:hypothetical protein
MDVHKNAPLTPAGREARAGRVNTAPTRQPKLLDAGIPHPEGQRNENSR